jgi:sulfite exporter TauE/SafE
MHCNACITLVESEVMDHPDVTHARASLKNQTLMVSGSIASKSPNQIIHDLMPVLVKLGYTLSEEPQKHSVAWQQFSIAIPLALMLLAAFWGLQKLGIVNLVSLKDASYLTAITIGVIASLSTCMAIVGGLTLSISANFAKEGDSIKPQTLFHAGRLIAFFLLGGIIGSIGTQFEFSDSGTFVLSITVGIVMLLLGLKLLDIFPKAKSLLPTLPNFALGWIEPLKSANHTLTPALLGILTFFLPCGFTQSMQIYTLTSGGFIPGALTMGFFALGTLPVLGLMSFASLGLKSPWSSGIFFKTSGLVVTAFAITNIYAALLFAGYI